MQLSNPFKKRKAETSKKTLFSNNKPKKPPRIQNISKPSVDHSFKDFPFATPETDNDSDSVSNVVVQTSDYITKTYIEEKCSESDYSYQDMPKTYHSREHISQLENTSHSVLKAYQQEKKKRRNKKKLQKEAKTERSRDPKNKTAFDFLMSKDIDTNSTNSDQPEKKSRGNKFSIVGLLKHWFTQCKDCIKKLYSTIYDMASGKHVAKEFFWTGGIVAVCCVIIIILSSKQEHNMIFYSLKNKTIHLANADQLASQYDLDSDFEAEEDWEDDEDWEDYEDWEDDEDWEDYEDWEDWEDDEDWEDWENDEDWEEDYEEWEDWEDDEDWEEDYVSPIDFEYLQENDEYIYAWIYIPGTAIDDPIIQNDEDDYYSLEYALDDYEDEDEDEDEAEDEDEEFEDEDDIPEDFSGYIYSENITATDFTDNNTIIFGHNMKNGTVFSDLENFLDANFFKESDTIYIYTPEEELEYTIFAAYLFEDIDLAYTFDFTDDEIYSTYLSKIVNINTGSSNTRSDVNVTASDKILTLITTYSKDTSQRVYVQAVLKNSN